MLSASFLRRLWYWLRRRNLESDFEEEIRQHLDLKIQQNIESGMSRAEASRQAHLEFGNPALARERTRQHWGLPLLESIAQDFRMGTRQLRRRKGFALVAVLTLALGIGINVAVFSLVNAILLAPLPYPHSARLVDVDETEPAQGIEREEVSYPNFLEFMRRSHSFSQMAAFVSSTYTLRAEGEPERVRGSVVSANLFSMLGGTLEAGWEFTAEDDRPGGGKAVLLSHALWRRRFGADPAIVGKTIVVDDELYTVAGIMNAGFRFPSVQTDLWLSLGPLAGQSFMQRRGVHILSVLAQLKDGASVRQAAAELRAIAAAIQQQFPTEDPGHSANVVPLKEVLVRDALPALLMLSGSVLFVLLIASANIANLLVSRATVRRREMAIRKALGATRTRILRQLLTESLVLSILGTAAGLLLAKSVLMAASAQLATLLPRMEEVRIDSQVLLFALLLSLVTGVLFGMAPALHSAKSGAEGEVCKSTVAGAGGSQGSRLLPRALIVAEIAVTVLLLVPAGLLMKSFARLLQADRGFDSDNLLTMTVSLPSTNYQTGEQVAQFFD
ncbi:MAG TPA: ABC transporter permease, partial [Candidatus Angelobacter sp.]